MPRAKSLPFVKTVRSRGRVYLYFRTGQMNDAGAEIMARLPDPSLPQFGGRYAALMAARTRRQDVADQLTVKQLAEMYERSPRFARLSAGSKRNYAIYLDKLVAEMGPAPAGLIERRDMALMLDKIAGTPGAANSLLKITSTLYRWARERGHVENDPCRDIALHEGGEYDPWPQSLVEAALASDDQVVRLGVHLLLYTAQRIGDVCRMRWADIEEGAIRVRQEKTGKPLTIALHRSLADELARYPRSLGTILTIDGGQAGTAQLRYRIRQFTRSHGRMVVPHGLRKNAVNALLEAGCSAAETSAISGQSLAMVEHYARGRAQAALGSAAILKWERKA